MLLNYITKRILQLIPLIIAISVIVFVIIQLPPGDYLTQYIKRLELAGNDVDKSAIENLKLQYGLDKPAPVQYLMWIRNIITKGDMGRSFQWNQPVTTIIGERVGLTMTMSLLTLLFVWLLAVPIGIFSATHQYSIFDYIVTFLGFIGLAVPGFLIALVAVYVIFVNTGVALTGLFSPEYLTAPWSFAKFLNMLPRLGLCLFVIGMSSLAGLIRTMRAMLLDELQKQYVTTARAKGVVERKLLFKYPVRVAINPMISTIGWTLPGLISGETIVSIVLNMPTMGPIMLRSLMTQDMYLAGSFLLITSLLAIIGTLLSDILLAVVDPRIKFGGVAE
jgi:peptide/nickel transport system permease protein